MKQARQLSMGMLIKGGNPIGYLQGVSSFQTAIFTSLSVRDCISLVVAPAMQSFVVAGGTMPLIEFSNFCDFPC